MSSTADWFARKLGQEPATTHVPLEQRSTPPNVWPGSTPPRPAYTQPTYSGPPTDENGQVTAGDAIAHWQGGDGVRASTRMGGCPGCGSGNYFPMGNAAPRCFDCGFPVQQGQPRG